MFYDLNEGETMKTAYRSNTRLYKRLLLIDKGIASGRFPSEKDLLLMLKENDLSVSRATFYLDLEALKNDFKAPINLNKDKGGYEYTTKTFRIPALLTTEEQINAAKIMRNMLDIIEGTPLYNEAKTVFETLSTISQRESSSTNDLEAENFSFSDLSKKRVIFLGAACTNFSDEIWNTVISAIKKNVLISFMYKTVYETGEKKRTIQPWQLIFDNGNWNVYGYDYRTKTARLYTLAQMSEICLRKETFTLPKDFDFKNVAVGSFGCYIGTETYHFSIKLTGYIAHTASKRIWGKNQSIKELPHTDDPECDSIILSFDNNQFYPILTWIQSWGADAVPLEPSILVEEWKNSAKQLASVVDSY